MDSVRWRKVESVYQAALARPSAERLAVLDSECSDDPELHRELASLLKFAEEPDSLLQVSRGSAAAKAVALESGMLLADRYRVGKLLGAGGMGEVYQAFDTLLTEDVALKVIRPEIVGREDTAARFRREVQAAQRITHPNICRIHDLHQHSDTTGIQFTFFTMELLRGETLRSRLERGPLPIHEAERIADQLTSALKAAHEAGVIHCDFKSDNVILTASPGAGIRAVVTDFGLACSRNAGLGGAFFTDPGQLIGTPAYMAPEQLLGEPLTQAVDIYALGVVLYEMVTALQPFTGDSSFAIAVRRFSYAPVPPSAKSPGLPKHWDTAVLGCLEFYPAKRFRDARNVWNVISKQRVRCSRLRPTLAAVLTVLLVASCAAWWVEHPVTRRQPSVGNAVAARPFSLRKSVAVIGFQNLSGNAEEAWLGTAFSEMLNTELGSDGKLRMIAGEDVANLRLSSQWGQNDSLAQKTAARISMALNADFLVLGSYLNSGGPKQRQLRLDVRLQDARTGEILAQVGETGSSQDSFPLISKIGARVRAKLGVKDNRPSSGGAESMAMPSNREASVLYSTGLRKLRAYDFVGARDLLEQSTRADPNFPLSHSALAEAWSQLGYEQNRRQEARKALNLSTKLPRANRMLAEGIFYESVAQHEKAASTYRALFAFFPDSVDYGLRLAEAQTAAAQRDQAMDTIAELRRLRPPACDDPRIDLAEVRAMPDDKSAQLLLVRKALAKAANQNEKLVYARARKWECMLLIYGSDPKQGKSVCEDAANLFFSVGNRLAAADAIRLIGDGEGTQGHSDSALASYRRALTILYGLGEEHEKVGMVLNNMANIYLNRGDLELADRLFRKAKDHFDVAGDKPNSLTSLGNRADVLFLRGELPAAAGLYQKVIDEGPTTSDRSFAGYAIYRLADLEMALGHVDKARILALEAVKTLSPIHGAYEDLTAAMNVLGDALMAQADFAGARSQYEQGLRIRQNVGEQRLVAESNESLAELALAEGHLEAGEALLNSALAEFGKEQAVLDIASANLSLSRILLSRGKVEQARQAIQNASRLAGQHAHPALALAIAVQSAWIDTVMGGVARAAARSRLRSTIITAKKLGYYPIECEGRLALIEAERKTDPNLHLSSLLALQKETHERGLELLSRRATILATPK